MKITDLNTKEINTWCPGCPNFGILQSSKEALVDLVNANKIKLKDIAIASGVGCHAKIFDYLNLSSFYGIHGRVLPTCFGMSVANPELTVIGFGGDGDTYAEGMSHFVHSCRHNANMTMIVHNNQVFSLTTGQATPTSEKGFIGASTPFGNKEEPLNPLALALVSGASFVARSYALDAVHLKETIKEAILHKGFSYIDVLQPCITFHNALPYFQKNIYKLEKNRDLEDLEGALKLAQEWDYSFDKNKKVSIGIFYKKQKPLFNQERPQLQKVWYTTESKPNWEKSIEEFK